MRGRKEINIWINNHSAPHHPPQHHTTAPPPPPLTLSTSPAPSSPSPTAPLRPLLLLLSAFASFASLSQSSESLGMGTRGRLLRDLNGTALGGVGAGACREGEGDVERRRGQMLSYSCAMNMSQTTSLDSIARASDATTTPLTHHNPPPPLIPTTAPHRGMSHSPALTLTTTAPTHPHPHPHRGMRRMQCTQLRPHERLPQPRGLGVQGAMHLTALLQLLDAAQRGRSG